MSLYRYISFARILCVALAVFTFCFTSVVFAQVPASNPAKAAYADNTSGINDALRLHDNIPETANTTIKVMAPLSMIPFGSLENSANAALLDMKGLEQEFVRSFTFKNTSSRIWTINSVDFEQAGSVFEFLSIRPGKTLPFEVAPGESFSIRIAFHGIERSKLYTNVLKFTTDQSRQPIVYPIQALQLPLSTLPWNNRVKN